MRSTAKSKLWPVNSTILIRKKEKEIILYKETDDKGHVQTNKKTWKTYKATVILGTIKELDWLLEVPEGVLIWTCEIGSRGRLSKLVVEGKTYSKEEVTVIIHVND